MCLGQLVTERAKTQAKALQDPNAHRDLHKNAFSCSVLEHIQWSIFIICRDHSLIHREENNLSIPCTKDSPTTYHQNYQMAP